ncbi:MAG TPA: phosphohistidine phosphatase SixA [Candidatus Didemnitutus sp.]|nr:phosphohistidine phosphatase SixA [Candidatus Didemnitutus sp.]
MRCRTQVIILAKMRDPPVQQGNGDPSRKNLWRSNPMKIFLVRHAHAVDGEPDDLRPLSSKGRKQIRTMAPFLKAEAGFDPTEIWHSPLLRAVQTAEQVSIVSSVTRRCEVGGLRPDDDPRAIAARLAATRKSVAVVGHEPNLSALATALLGDSMERPLVVLKKCAILTLERERGVFRVSSLVAP